MPQALKDCRTCNRRRIRCDRSVPACLKCASRDLVCPGYSKKLKWVCGAVSKGPHRQDFQVPNDDRGNTEHANHDHPLGLHQDQGPVFVDENNTLAISGLGSCATAFSAMALIEVQLHQPETVALLSHFNDVVASQLAWYDNDTNPWRKLIVPLAMDSRALFAAILAMSSGNIAARMGHGSKAARHYLQSMQLLRDETLTLLSADFRKLGTLTSTETWLPSHSRWATATLASAIVLSYLEVHFPVSGLWRVHLRAARQVIQAIQKSSTGDEIISFLAEEFFAATTWSLLTDFDPASHTTYDCYGTSTNAMPQEMRKLLEDFAISHQDSGFAGFCLGLRRITKLERLRQQTDTNVSSELADRDSFPEIDQLLSEARHRAFQAVGLDSLSKSATEEMDVRHLIDALYHATSIYKARALQRFTRAISAIIYHRDQLFHALLAFRDAGSFAQDQTWPLFVAGTECVGDILHQTWIRGRFQCIMTRSCALDRPRVLNFLETFWLQSDTENWIDFARQSGTEASFLIL